MFLGEPAPFLVRLAPADDRLEATRHEREVGDIERDELGPAEPARKPEPDKSSIAHPYHAWR